MNEFTGQNLCKYADELVAYLYNEANEAEKSRFEVHLVNCASCVDELADFSMVRSSIVEWREAEFTPLAIPAIELPVRQISFTPEISESGSLSARIRALFSLSPAWAGAGATAALVICIGLLLVAVNFRHTPETARVEKEAKIETIPSPTTEETAELRTAISDDNKENAAEKSSEPPVISVKEDKPKNENVAVKLSQPVTAKNKKAVAEKSVRPIKPVLKKANQGPPPTLMADEDEYEDNSLRLSDIFKGIGGR